MNISESFIHDAAHSALSRHGYIHRDNCDSINNELLSLLEEWVDDTVTFVPAMQCKVNGVSHWVASIPAEMYAGTDTDDGVVIIDAALKQFEDSLDTDIPEVVILPPRDDRRDKWYTDLRLTTGQEVASK